MDFYARVFIFIFVLILGYIFGKKWFFAANQARRVRAMVTGIKIHKVDKIYTPEIEVFYRYQINQKTYTGSDFIWIDSLLPDTDFVLTERGGFPVLLLPNAEFVGEEYIEAFFIDIIGIIYVEVEKDNPSHSRIYRTRKKRLFQNVSVHFPWET